MALGNSEFFQPLTYLASVNSPKTFRFRHRSSVRKPAAGNHQTAHNEGEHDFPCRDIAYQRKESALSEKIEARPYHGSENNHRMQPDKPPLEESPCSHLSPSVIVCIAYHESRKDEKEKQPSCSKTKAAASQKPAMPADSTTYRISAENSEALPAVPLRPCSTDLRHFFAKYSVFSQQT